VAGDPFAFFSLLSLFTHHCRGMRELPRKQRLLPENVKMLWQASPATSDGGGGGNSDDGTNLTGTSERTLILINFMIRKKCEWCPSKPDWLEPDRRTHAVHRIDAHE
jgi:hypothetical protein